MVKNIACCVVIAVTATCGHDSSAQQFFSDRSAFLAQTKTGYYEEKFDGWSEGDPLDGHQPEWEAPGNNGFGWMVSAPGPGNEQLYSLYRSVSTSSYNDSL